MANEFKIKNGLIVSGSADFEQDLRVRGTLTVDELHTSITSSSIFYESGSTVFGNTLDDTHQLTGSVAITGSITLNGQAIGTGKLDETTFNSYTSSINTTIKNKLDNDNVISGSVQVNITGTTGYSTFSSSISTSIGELSSSVATTTSGLTSTITSLSSSLTSSIGSLSSSVASINNTQNGRLDSLETASGSIRSDFNSFTSSYTTVSSSLDSRLDVLEAYSGSQQVPTASYSLRTTRTDVYCKNMSGVQINKGTVVRITGAVGDNPLIGVASLLTEGESANTLGIAAENIPNDSFGLVITEGVLLGVNTSGMTAGQLIFLGANGTFTTSYPVAPNHGVRLGEVLRDQQNQGSIYVRVDNGSELGEAHDVYDTTTNSSYGDLLVKSGSVWINSRNLNGDYSVTGSLNATSFTGSINYNNLTNVPTLVSGSSQILNGSNIVSSSTQVTNYGFAITGSNLFKGDQTHSGSIIPAVDNAYDLGSPTHQWRDVYISSGSLYIDGTKVISSTTQELQITTDNGQSIKILESGTDSIILQTADGDIELKSNADGDILLDPTNGKIMLKGAVEILNGQKIQSSVGGTPVVFANDIVVSGSIDITGTIEGIDLTAFSSSVNTRLGNLESAGGNLNTFTASANTRLGNLETESGSIRTTVNSYTSSTNNRLTSIETTTGSILSTNTTQDGRLTSIESKTGSYSTTGSNVFIGNQTITGSLYVSQDLIIAGSSSIQHISSSVVNIADNIITVNAQNPSIRFGGLAVIDSGSSPQVSGSMLFDSTNDQWIFVHQNQTAVTSSVLLMGPQTFNNLGSETYPTTNRILKSLNAEHVGDSNISDNGTTVTILSNTIINGTISATGTTIVSGSAQISFNGITDKPALVSGSSQVSFNGITDKPALVSGSAQISFNTITDKPALVSGSSQISYPSLSNIPSGIVSGSSQIDLTATTNYSSGIKTRLNAENVLSSSAQVVSALPAGTVSGSSQVLAGTTIHSGSFFNGISVVSGSSQITYSGISSIPSGIVSGSSQITFSGISSIPSGLVSGSSQITFGSISSIPSGLVSGSSQITYSSISSIPSGIVSGSAQLTSTFVQKAGDNMTGLLSVGYSRTDEPFIQGHFYNTSTTTSTQYGGILASGINQAHIRFQVGTNTWGASGAKQWQIRVGNGAGEDNMKIYSWTYGNDVLTISSNATATFAGNLSAANLSGTNTGDQTNITGNAGTVTNGVYTTSNNYLSAGNKIVIQNSSDGGSSRGIFMWNGTDPNWGIYMSQAGASKTIADTTAPAGIDGRTEHAIRFRVANSTGQIGFLWENNADVALMQLQPNTGNLYTRGQIYAGNSTSNLVLHTGNYNSYALPLNGGQLNGLVSFSDNAYFTGAPSHGFRWNSSNNAFNNVIMRDNGNMEVRGSLIAGSVGSAPQATIQAVGGLRWSSGGNSYYTYTDMDTGGLYIETKDNNTSRAKMRFQTRVNDSGSYTSYHIDANNLQHYWVVNGNTRLTMDSSGHILPGANGTQNLGSSSLRWNTVFTSDLSLSNGIGDYTIVEGENDLFLYNNKQNKVYKFMLQEVNAEDATPKRPE